MASNKRSARQRKRAAFEADLSDLDLGDIFGKEERRREHASEQRETALRHKACASKNRYATRAEAQDAIATCAAYGRTGLSSYRCPYCKGWHLTSHPQPTDV